MKRPVKLSLLRDERKRDNAKSFRADMYTNMREITQEAGDDIAGYAIVVWNKDGANWSSLKSGGPIMWRMVPTFAGDALTQHVAIDIATGRR